MYLMQDGKQVAYWRKANAIHKWFVDHVQDGFDDCGTYPVSRDELSQLLSACKEVLETAELNDGDVYAYSAYGPGQPNGPVYRDGQVLSDTSIAIAKRILPTQEGFIFGCTDYDEWYIFMLDQTLLQLGSILAKPGDKFTYYSSW